MKTQPTQPTERIVSLDVLRGFAVLGILIMNIQSFSMIGAAYLNPTAYGNFEGANKWVWIVSHVLADMKFMTLFSILFGAGVVLFTERLKAKGIKSVALHYRRTLWLLVFGLAHAYLLWYGDILVAYAISGLWVVLFRKSKPKTLLIIGLVVFSIASVLYLLTGMSLPFMPEESKEGMLLGWLPGQEYINAEIAAYQCTWLEQMNQRIDGSIMMQTIVFFMQTGWRAGGLMLIGMALYKWGILSAKKSRRFYVKLGAICLFAGLVIVIFGMKTNFDNNFSMEYSFFIGSQFNYWGSLLVSLGYLSLVVIFVKSGIMPGLQRRVKAVGQMAFTNYLMQTIICTTIFYGHGFGLYGKMERMEQIMLVFAIWIFQMILSPVWLKYFRFGPFEWLWRGLTYRNFQPIKKELLS
jgi:uncharacterized protein